MGVRFAKWRTIVTIGEGIPTRVCIDSNAHALARYAALCQEADIVPIVEPEVYMDGEHTIEQSEQITASVLLSVFAQLKEQKVNLSGIILKPNMVLSGYKCSNQASREEVAETTIRTLLKVVPKEVSGIAFLSGGQDPKLVTARLNEMCKRNDLPWKLTFSFERALEDPTMTIWAGKEENVKNAQDMLYRRARYNSLATKGQYQSELENE
jgi:fructose-bisphosphate aldolase class I